MRMKRAIIYVATGGGHLTELLLYRPRLSGVSEILISDRPGGDEFDEYIPQQGFDLKRPCSVLRSFIVSFLCVCRYRPKIIVSTGAEIAIPYVIFGKLLCRSKVLYVECSAQVYKKSQTGRLCYYLADEFFVQWPPLLKVYGKKAKFRGGFLCTS